jgi:hypothetical protein
LLQALAVWHRVKCALAAEVAVAGRDVMS